MIWKLKKEGHEIGMRFGDIEVGDVVYFESTSLSAMSELYLLTTFEARAHFLGCSVRTEVNKVRNKVELIANFYGKVSDI